MNYSLVLKVSLAFTVVVLIVVGCLARGESMPSFELSDYENALDEHLGHTRGIERGLENFSASFSDLTREDLGERIESLYAENLYFNDTIHTFHNRDQLRDYMVKTGKGLDESVVKIDQVIRDDRDVFVRWTMEFKTRVAGKKVHSKSIGMTQLRFNEEGQIVLHQDFWDSGNALFAHLPIVGFVVRSARNQM
ncbi:MAG: nuclear transport factor 2 family protein [Wenzhouxiangella sp.]|nr:nuclear transport factor 2 family protein [Wenzhouxiangella sp.]